MKFSNSILSLCTCGVVASVLFCTPAQAVLIKSGNGNTTAPLSVADGGPGDPGFAYVGKSSNLHGSVTYLGNGWCITADHVDTRSLNLAGDPGLVGVTLGGVHYNIDPTYINSVGNDIDNQYRLRNNDATHSFTDLKVFRIVFDGEHPDPGLAPLVIATSAPAPGNQVIMVGNGFDSGVTQQFWNATWGTTGNKITKSGFNVVNGSGLGNRTIRWGENYIQYVNQQGDYGYGMVHYFSTIFDYGSPWTNGVPFSDEATGTQGDSGGAVFRKVDGQWQLAGIMVFMEGASNQPTDVVAFGNKTWIADLSQFHTQIQAIIPDAVWSGDPGATIPEPSSWTLAAAGVLGFGYFARRRKRRTTASPL